MMLDLTKKLIYIKSS